MEAPPSPGSSCSVNMPRPARLKEVARAKAKARRERAKQTQARAPKSFPCDNCSMVYSSHQALGGHRNCHRKPRSKHLPLVLDLGGDGCEHPIEELPAHKCQQAQAIDFLSGHGDGYRRHGPPSMVGSSSGSARNPVPADVAVVDEWPKPDDGLDLSLHL